MRERCECYDVLCHNPYVAYDGTEINRCMRPASTTGFRLDMDDQSGTRFCDSCADDASESGLFSFVDDSEASLHDLAPDCYSADRDECAMMRERSVAGTSDAIPDCPTHR